MKLIHVFTNTTDWGCMNYDKFMQQDITHLPGSNPQKQLRDILNFIQVWDDTYAISFFQFRKELAEIAQGTFDKVGFDDTIMLSNLFNYLTTIDDCYIMISDDDDWYNPAIGDIIRSCETDVVSWDDVSIQPPLVVTLRSSRNGKTLWTNSWAIRKNAYLKIPAKNRHKLKYHVTASSFLFPKDHHPFTHKFLSGGRYSVACKSVSSHCKYFAYITKPKVEIAEHLKSWRISFHNDGIQIENACFVKWAKEEIAKYVNLCERLFNT